MDINNLKIFVAFANGDNMTDIATAYGTSKSNVSYVVSSIEKELGTELIVRPVKRYRQLTESGVLFLTIAKSTIETYESGIEQLQSLKGGMSGDLRIGVGSFVEPYLRKAVAKVTKENPSIKINAHVYRANTLNQMLKNKKLDVAFTLNKAYDGEGIVSVPCIPIKIMAVMSKRHALAKKDVVTFDELCKYDCIMPSEDRRAFATINQYIDKDLTKLRTRISINTADGALNMVEEENYITFMTRQHIVNRPHLVAIPIEGLDIEIKSNMHYLEGVHLKKSVLLLQKALEDFAIPLLNMTEL